jgi:hypothetical protein
LKTKQCPKNLYKLVQSYFSQRKARLSHAGEVEKGLSLGCPQGSASGQGFWNISYDDIFELGNNEDIQLISFADDTNLMVFADTIQELEDKTNEKLKQIENRAKESKLGFNVDKTQTVLFTQRLKYDEPIIHFRGERLKLQSNVKYLGLQIDSKLTFKAHNNYLKTRTTELLNKILRFSKNKFGLNSKALSTIHKGCILPIISYGVSVWIKAIDCEYNKHYLNIIQRRVVLRLCKAYNTVSLNACELICNFTPIDMYLKARAVEYFMKHNITNEWTESYFADTSIDIKCTQKPIDTTKVIHFGLIFSLQIVNEISADCVTTYGVKTREGVGAALEIWQLNVLKTTKKIKLADNCSSFQANLLAVDSALQPINKNNKNNYILTIATNNATVNKALASPYTKNSQMFNIYTEVRKASQRGIQIELLSTPNEEIMTRHESTALKARRAVTSHNRIAFDLVPSHWPKTLSKIETLSYGTKDGRNR